MEIINHRSIFEKIVKMIVLQQIKLKIKKNEKKLKKDFTNKKISDMIYITEAKKASMLCL